MRKKIKKQFLLIAAIAVMATAVCAVMLFYHILTEQIYDDLRAEAEALAGVPAVDLPTVSEGDGKEALRMTLIGSDGVVLYDSGENVAAMGNHSDRPEVAQALTDGEGCSMRRSKTLGWYTFYYARRLENGTILRIGKASGSISRLVWMMTGLTMCVGAAVFLLCVFLAGQFARRIVGPIERMSSNLMLADENTVYEELRPFIATIKRQHADILNHARLRQEFTANVSHELKTPLTAISGYAELIASGMTNEGDTRHFAGEIRRSAEHLQNLINDIIKLSELDDENRRLETEPVDLYAAGARCVEQMKLSAREQGVTITQEGVPVTVNGDRTLIEELFYNLCSNAVRYNRPGGTVTVETGLEHGRPMLCVKDTGIGIPGEHQERIFERFYRVDKSRSRATGGTGLGLAIVKHIVVWHDAQIQLTSEEGKGTQIKVIF